MRKPKSQSLFFFFLCTPLEKKIHKPFSPLEKKKKKKKIHDNQRNNKNTNKRSKQKPHEPNGESMNQRTQVANPSNKTHELRWRTHDPGDETHKPKLGLNPRTCMIPLSEGRFPSILSFLFVQSRNSSILKFHWKSSPTHLSFTGNRFLPTQFSIVNSSLLDLGCYFYKQFGNYAN